MGDREDNLVTLSEAKGLCLELRCFALLSMTTEGISCAP